MNLRKLNILLFSTDYKPNSGGIAEHTYQIAKHLHQQGCYVVVLSVRKIGWRKFDENQMFETYRVNKIPFLLNFSLFFHLLYLCKKEHVNCVYSTITHPCGEMAYLGALFLRYKTIIGVHGYEVSYSGNCWKANLKRQFKPVRTYIYNHIDKVFAVSEYTRQRLVQSGVKSTQIQVFPNGVNIDEWLNNGKDEELIQRYNLKDKKIILTVGSLIPRKGQDTVIKAINMVKTKIPNVRYLIAGEGPNEICLKDLVAKENLTEYVILLGRFPQERLNLLYNTCDLLVMPNREAGTSVEGFGIAFLEANACKKPVIGGDSGGTADAVVSGKTGFLVDPNDERELAGKIIELLRNPDMAQKMGEQGFNRVKDELTWNKIVSGIKLSLESI